MTHCTSSGYWMKAMQHLMESELAGATKVFGETLPQCHSVRSTWAAVMRSHRLTASAMAQPTYKFVIYLHNDAESSQFAQ